MKNIILIFVIFFVLLLGFGCKQSRRPEPSGTESKVSTTTQSTEPKPSATTQSIKTKISTTAQSTQTEVFTTIRKTDQITFAPEEIKLGEDDWPGRRQCYTQQFDEINELFPAYAFEILWDSYGRGGQTPPEMHYVVLVKKYDIPKEKFEKAIQKAAKRLLAEGHDLSQEEYELPNADIVYTFDNDIIRSYYSRLIHVSGDILYYVPQYTNVLKQYNLKTKQRKTIQELDDYGDTFEIKDGYISYVKASTTSRGEEGIEWTQVKLP